MKSYKWFICVVLFNLSILLVSCKNTAESIGYSEYFPSKGSPLRITFEYPSEWEWTTDEDTTSIEYTWIYTGSSNAQSPFNGGVQITFASFQSPDEALAAMEGDISYYLKASNTIRAEILSDQTFEIDGYTARQISRKIGPRISIGQDEPLISEDFYILVDNSYYVIHFSILESHRHSDFGDGFDRMIKSIKFIR